MDHFDKVGLFDVNRDFDNYDCMCFKRVCHYPSKTSCQKLIKKEGCIITQGNIQELNRLLHTKGNLSTHRSQQGWKNKSKKWLALKLKLFTYATGKIPIACTLEGCIIIQAKAS